MPRCIAALIRHGEYHQLANTPSAHQPFALTGRGIEQANRAARDFSVFLDEQGWMLHPHIHCSNMQRAWQTAVIFADVLKTAQPGARLDLQQFDVLAERGLGCAANLSIDVIENVLKQDTRFEAPPPGWKSDSHYRLPLQGAESLMQAGQRVAAHLQRAMRDLFSGAAADTVQLFVGHGAAFRHAACELGMLRFDQLAELSMFHAKPVLVEYLRPGEWSHIGGDWKVRCVTEPQD